MCNAKGSRVCSLICITCAVISFVSLGCVLLFGGVAILVERSELSRVDNYNAVVGAVNVWNTPSSPYSRSQLSQLNASAVLVAGPGATAAAGSCPTTTLSLVPELCATDTYTDAAPDFQPVPQLKLCGRVDYLTYVQCDYQVTYWATQPGGTVATYNLTAPLDVSQAGPSWVVIDLQGLGGDDPCASAGTRRCFGDPYNRCKSLCENTYGGTFSCNTFSNSPYTCEANAWTGGVAVKVVAFPANNTYGVDAAIPDLGNGGAGANILRQGIRVTMPTQINGAPQWLYGSFVYFVAPTAVTVMVRSAGDPYLTYMAVTGGSGWLGLEQVALGGIALLGGLLFSCCIAWGCGLARDQPQTAPEGCVERQAWGMGIACCPPTGNGKVAPDAAPATATEAAGAPAEAPPMQQMVAYPVPGGGFVWVPVAALAAGAAGMAAGAAAAGAAGQPYPPQQPYPPAGPDVAVGPAAGPAAAQAELLGVIQPHSPGAAGGEVPVAPPGAAVQQSAVASPPPAAAAVAPPAAPAPAPPPAAAAAVAPPPPASPAGALPPLSGTMGGMAAAAGGGLPPLASRPVLPPL